MRNVRIKGAPSAEWLKKADDLLNELRAETELAARNKIIDDNCTVWGELKEWLLGQFHEKCWFSEAKDCFNHWDVEHYRPKKAAKDADGTAHDGYWWLAFDWRNFRICGDVGNRKKGTFFPLRAGCARVGLGGDLRHEDPILLDPADEDDPNLLSFTVDGRAVPAPHVHDEWEQTRVVYSIKKYKLDFGPLEDRRKTVWAECWSRIKEYQAELELYHRDKTNAVAKEGYRKAMKRLRELTNEEAELSAVAVACIKNSGDPRVAHIV